jgi:S1-C subfamily serine protease
MYRRHILTAAVTALVLAVLPALASAQDTQTQTRSRGAFLGITAESTPEEAQHEGAIVRNVTPNTPAAKAGLKRGDIITKVGSKTVNDFEDLENALSQHKAGQKVNLQVLHNGQQKQMTVTLSQRPNQFAEEGENGQLEGGQRGQIQEQPGYYSRRGRTAFLGVQAEELTSNLRNQEGISARQGVFINEVMPNSPAAEAGLRQGDVITKVNDEPVTNPEDLRKALQNAGVGHEVTLDVLRGNRHRELTAQLEQGGAQFNQQQYGFSDQSREIQMLEQRIQQLEKRIRRLEQSRQGQTSGF